MEPDCALNLQRSRELLEFAFLDEVFQIFKVLHGPKKTSAVLQIAAGLDLFLSFARTKAH